MALDPEERKIATLLAAFEEIHTRVEQATRRFEQSAGTLEPAMRQTIRQALGEELAALEQQANAAAAALEAMRRAANWRQVLLGGALAVLVAGITLGGFWLLTPSRQEILQLRAERAQLESAIDLLASRGGRADLKTCGVGNAHLCVRVEPRLGRYGEEKDYFVIRGY
jgi:hypothetical protein